MHNSYKLLVEKSTMFEKRLDEMEKKFSKDEESIVNNKDCNLSYQYKQLEDMIFTNKETFNKIEDDLKHIEEVKANKYSNQSLLKENNIENKRRFKYYSTGYCKLKESFPFFHPEGICKEGNCKGKSCDKRYLKNCKYLKKDFCRFGTNCEFTHRAEQETASKNNSTNSDNDATNETIENRIDSEMEIENPEEIEIQHKCEWCNVNVGNCSSTSYS